MNMLIFKNDDGNVELEFLGYAYDATGDKYDDNWLKVRLDYNFCGAKYSLEEPCVTAQEIQAFKKIIPDVGNVSSNFMEKHLNFSVKNRATLILTPRFYLAKDDYTGSDFVCQFTTRDEIKSYFENILESFPVR